MSNNNNNEDNNDDEGWHTVAPRQRRTTAVTPDTTPVRQSPQELLRAAAALFNEDDGPATAPNSATAYATPIPVPTEVDIDFEDMTPSHPPAGSLATMVGPFEPDRTPTSTTLTVFQKMLANHLSTAPSRMTQGGYAWLIEDEDLIAFLSLC